MSNDLVEAIANMKEEEALNLANKMYQEGENPSKILEFCREAMEIVGKRFEKEEYFLPELVLGGEMLKKIANIVQGGIEKGLDAGLRDNVKIMIGGGQIDDDVKQYTGTDAYGLDAMDAVKLSKRWIGGE